MMSGGTGSLSTDPSSDRYNILSEDDLRWDLDTAATASHPPAGH